MKIGPSTIGAVVFTVVSVAAFGWMTQRPKVSGQAVGFAMPFSGSTSSSTGATSADAPKDTTDSSDTSATESATPDKTTAITEKAPSDSDAETSTDEKTPASTDVVVESEQTTESSDAISAESQSSSKTALAEEKAAITNHVESIETSTPESTTPTEQPSESVPSSLDPENSTEQQPETASEQSAPSSSTVSSETTTTNTSPDIQAVPLKSDADAAASASADIYTAATNATGTVVILQGCDYKTEGDDNVVRSLHKNLPQEGWNTLSLQLPNLSASSTYKDLEEIMPDAAARIESGIAMAKEKSQTPVVLFAHGCGAHTALAWMEVKGSDAINGYIGLGVGVMNASADDASHLRLPLEKMKFPQLDIYGSEDNEAVLKTAPERLSHINRAANPASRQKKIEGADHNITGKGKELSDVVVTWLNDLAFKK